MQRLREGFDYYAENGGEYLAVNDAATWIAEVDEAIAQLQKSLESYQGDGRSLGTLGGYVAERWHAGTFNIDAAIKGSADHAAVPKPNELGSVDVHLDSGADYSLKYYKHADRSLREQAMTFGEKARSGSSEAARAIDSGKVAEGDLLYGDQQRLIPEDQLDEAHKVAFRKIAKERLNRPEQADRYSKTDDLLTDRIINDEGVESKGLTKQGSRDLAQDAKTGEVDLEKFGISKQQLIQLEDVLKKSFKAGMSAAVIAATLAAAPALLEAFDHLVKTGEIDAEKMRFAGTSALSGGARGFLTGSATAAIVSSAGSGLLGEALRELNPSVIGAVAVVAVNAIGNSMKVASGNMEPCEMADALARDAFVASAAVLLGGTVQAFLPELPVLGYLLGSFVGSTAAGLAYSGSKRAVVALCVDTGFTLFGLVEQDYELPEEALVEIGIEVLEYDALMPELIEPDEMIPELIIPDELKPEGFELTFLRRGVVGVSKIAYVA